MSLIYSFIWYVTRQHLVKSKIITKNSDKKIFTKNRDMHVRIGTFNLCSGLGVHQTSGRDTIILGLVSPSPITRWRFLKPKWIMSSKKWINLDTSGHHNDMIKLHILTFKMHVCSSKGKFVTSTEQDDWTMTSGMSRTVPSLETTAIVSVNTGWDISMGSKLCKQNAKNVISSHVNVLEIHRHQCNIMIVLGESSFWFRLGLSKGHNSINWIKGRKGTKNCSGQTLSMLMPGTNPDPNTLGSSGCH